MKDGEGPQNARSRRTRAALLAATRELLEQHGFQAVTMAAVAERAGVTRRAVYLHFASRTELITGLFDYVGEQDGLIDSLRPVWNAPDAVSALREWAGHIAGYHPRILAVSRAADRVHREDPDAARHRDHVRQSQLTACRWLMAWLEAEHRLAPQWTVDTAAELLQALCSSDVVEGLLVERQWSTERFVEHFAQLYRATFTGS